MAESGMFKDARQPFQAMTKLMLGRDLGLSATASMTGIYLVEGRIELGSNLQAQMIRTWLGLGGERYDFEVEGPTDEGCAVTIYRANPGVTYGDRDNYERLGRAVFAKADAQKAGLLGKDNWKKYPRNMYFARAMSNAIAFFCPEVTGGVRLYAQGEISGDTDPGARAVDVGNFEARAEAMAAHEQPPEQQPEQPSEHGIADAHVVEDEPLTPEQQAEVERLDQEFGVTAPWTAEDVAEVNNVAEALAEQRREDPQAVQAEPTAPTPEGFSGQSETAFAEASLRPPQPQQAEPQRMSVEEVQNLQALVHQGLLEIGEGENVIAARLRGAKENPVALQNLLRFIENKKQQMEAQNG
jgi:hypothetical protein